MARYKETSD